MSGDDNEELVFSEAQIKAITAVVEGVLQKSMGLRTREGREDRAGEASSENAEETDAGEC